VQERREIEKREREANANAEAARKQAEDARRKEAADAKLKADEQREARKQAEREAKGVSGKVGGLLRGAQGSGGQRAEDIKGLTNQLKDGAESGELFEIAGALQEFVNAFAGMNQAKKNEIRTAAKDIKNLAERIKRLETQ
jgi:hypothetical protein